MSAITTKADVRSSALPNLVWKSLTISNGDTLATGLKEVWSVVTTEPAALSSWSVSSGVVTFVTTQVIGPGPVVVYGR